MRYTILAVISLLLMSVFPPLSAISAQEKDKEQKKSYLYQWTDDKGVVHITNGLGDVPEKYRTKTRKIETPEGKETGGVRGAGSETVAPRNSPEATEDDYRAAWRNRIEEWKENLANAEKRYRELEQKRNEALLSWGGANSGRLDMKIEAERLEKEMKEAQKEIDEARRMIDEVIPEEARKAGVPPGWLRE